MVEGNKRGPKSKINPVRISRILKSVESGNFFKVAVVANGVSEKTAYRWLSAGDQAIAAAVAVNPDVEDEIEDWLLVWPDNFNSGNPMWEDPPMTPFTVEEWLPVLFTMLYKRARARAEVKALQRLKGGKPGWQSAAWYLERTHVDRWGRSQTIQHTGADGGAIQVEAASPEAVKVALEALRVKRASRHE